MTTITVTTTPENPVAARIKVTDKNERQTAAVYKLSRPVEYTDKHERKHTTRFVWVSTTFETMAFACDAIGTVLDWGGLVQLRGRNSTHADALAELGFSTVIETK